MRNVLAPSDSFKYDKISIIARGILHTNDHLQKYHVQENEDVHFVQAAW